MGTPITKQSIFEQELITLHDSLKILSDTSEDNKYYKAFRDSVIKRFEYCADSIWKLLKEYLEKQHGLDVPTTPKGVYKYALDAKIITPEEYPIFIDIVEDRNRTSHCYNEFIAEEVSEMCYHYYTAMKTVFDRMKS